MIFLCKCKSLIEETGQQIAQRCYDAMLSLVKFQLMSMSKVTSEDVSMFLTAVLVGLQKHGQHENIQPALLTLALRIYELAVSSSAASSSSYLSLRGLQMQNKIKCCKNLQKHLQT